MSAVITLHGPTECILRQLIESGELVSSSLVISTDANTGHLVGRFIEAESLNFLNTRFLGCLLGTIEVHGFGLDNDRNIEAIGLRLQPVRGLTTETNLSFFFDVDLDGQFPQQKCLAC